MSNVQAPQLQEIPAASSSAEEVASQIDLTKMSLNAPVYKYRRFYQVQGGSSFTPTGSTYLSQFVIPGSSVWNFARSHITFDVAVNSGTADVCPSLFTDTFPVDSIQLQTDNGTVLCNIQNAQQYLKAAIPLVTDQKTLFSRGGATQAALGISDILGCNPADSNVEQIRTTAQLSVAGASAAYAFAATDNAVAAKPKASASGADRLIQRLVTCPANNAHSVRYRMDLSNFVGTILAVDKDMHFGTNLQLVIYYKPLTNWGFECKVANTDRRDLTAPTVSNYYLYMAEDINDAITMPMIEQVRSNGASIYVPYTVSSQFSTDATAGYASSNIPLVPGEGLRLKRILTNFTLSTNTNITTANTFNVAGVKYTSLQSYMDSKPLQDQELVQADSDLYNYLNEKCKDSVGLLSKRTFEENNFWLDDFSDCDSTLKIPENDCKLSGLSVDMQKNYALRINKLAVGLILCHWKTYVRNLTIKPSGISWGQ
jgi:hypothetical protein